VKGFSSPLPKKYRSDSRLRGAIGGCPLLILILASIFSVAFVFDIWLDKPQAQELESAIGINRVTNDQDPFVIASGPPNQVYSILGRILAKRLSDQTHPFIADDSGEGSIDNLRSVLVGEASLAIVQADVLFFAASGKVTDREILHSARYPLAVSPLFKETLHLFIRRPLNPSSIEEALSLNLYVGGQGSGSLFTIEAISAGLGVPDLSDNIKSESSQCAYGYWVGDENRNECAAFTSEQELQKPDGVAIMSVPGFPTVARFLALSPYSMSALENGSRKEMLSPVPCLTYLFSIDPSSSARIVSNFPIFTHSRIQMKSAFDGRNGEHETCVSSHDDVESLGIMAFLVAHSEIADELVDYVLRKLYPDNRNDLSWLARHAPIQAFHVQGVNKYSAAHVKEILENALSNSTLSSFDGSSHIIPFHPGVQRFLHRLPIWRQVDLTKWAYRIIPFLLLFILACFVAAWWDRVVYTWHRNRGLVLLFITVLVLLASAVVTYRLEATANSNFANLRQSTWSIMTWLLSGFEDRPPLTTGGQTGSVIFLASWAALILLLINYILKERMEALIEEDRLGRRMKNHYVICGWNERAIGIIRQLKGELLGKRREIQYIVVIAEDRQLPDTKAIRRRHGEYVRDVIFMRADAADKEAIAAARVEHAMSIVVLSQDDLGAGADGKTALIINGIRSYLNSLINDGMRRKGTRRLARLPWSARAATGGPLIVAEVREAHNRKQIMGIDRDLDAIDIETTDSRPIAQVARAAGLTSFFFDILSITPDSNELYVETLPEALHKRTFNEISEILVKLRREMFIRGYRVEEKGSIRNGIAGIRKAMSGSTRMFENLQMRETNEAKGNVRAITVFPIGPIRSVPESRFRFIPVGMKRRDASCVCVWPPSRKQTDGRCGCDPSKDKPPWNTCDLLLLAPEKPELDNLLKRKRIAEIVNRILGEMGYGDNEEAIRNL
jgi:TRAP-type uncharacterized transport system substrate-binding protein